DHMPAPDAIHENAGADNTTHEDAPTIASDAVSTSADDTAPAITGDDDDTAEHRAIVLPPEAPALADDMPDISHIEEADAGHEVETETEDETSKIEETPVVTDSGENATIEEEIPCHPEQSEESASPDNEILSEAKDDKTDSGREYLSDGEPDVGDAGEVLPENDTLTVPEQQAEPVIIESTIDMVDVAEAGVEDDAINSIPAEAEPAPDTSEGDSESFSLPEPPRKTSRSLVVRGQVLPATLPRASKERPAITGK